ncbi:MAG: hypothetical protein M0R68_04015 [Bacteroidetes bacterium]|nr:hypothetical protein [Bacteroidota bacterium]
MKLSERDAETVAIAIKSILNDNNSYVGDMTGKTPLERQDEVDEFLKSIFEDFEARVYAMVNDPEFNK